MKRISWSIAVLVCLLGASAAKAAPNDVREGIRLYTAGDYEGALAHFRAAYDANNDSQMLFNMGQCQRRLGRWADAIESYQNYLHEKPTAKNRPEVEKYIASAKEELDRQKAAEAPPPPPPQPAAAEPTPPAAAAPAVKLDLPSKYALGVRIRGIFVPGSFLAPYLKAYTSMNSVSTAIEFIYRKPNYDVVTSLDFSWLPVESGNYLANGHVAAVDTHFTEFRNLSFLSADVSIIGHHTWEKAPWFEFRYGAGIGLGVVLGDVLLTNDGGQCTDANASNIKQCYPINKGVPVRLGTPNQEADLKATQSNAGTDTADNPKRHVSSDKPPVMGVLNVEIGFKFRLHKHVSAQVEVGFRDAMFVGAGLHYWF